jgi:hypothetical protein
MVEGPEFDKFREWFDVMAITHGKSFSDDLRARTTAEYFDVLRPYPYELVQMSYETLRRKMKKWPVPADWLEALPPHSSVLRLPLMHDKEIERNDYAESVGYEWPSFCQCDVCVRDGATHLKPRFVPRIDAHGNVTERRHPARQGRAIILGRWIHGAELKAWCAARADFYIRKTAIENAMKSERFTVQQRTERMSVAAAGVIAEHRAD